VFGLGLLDGCVGHWGGVRVDDIRLSLFALLLPVESPREAIEKCHAIFLSWSRTMALYAMRTV
jgi:hypothetical protein